jgi:UDP-glucose 4-epimerase
MIFSEITNPPAPKRKKRALVTGAAGFIGSNLSRTLYESGEWYVDMVDNMSNGHLKFLDGIGGVKMLCDFTDELALSSVRSGKYDAVFHLAAVPRVAYSVENPAETTNENLNKTVKLLEACKGNVGRFIFSSSSSVVGDTQVLPTPTDHPKNPQSPYAMQKSMCEDFISLFCNLYSMDALCLRYFNVFGPHAYGDSPYSTAVAAWCDAIKHGKPMRSDGDGEQSRDMCYVGNVVSANMLAANSEQPFRGERYNVGCGDRVTNNEILEYFRKRFPNASVVNAPERAGDVKHTQADISETKDVLGYEPTVRFWEGLEKTIGWWQL